MTDKPDAASILVVDDKPDNLRLMTEVLQDAGYAVRVAPGGELALRSVATRLPDLILLDIKMPDLDGLAVCRQLKADRHSKDVPVIFLSALRDHEDKLRGFEAGGIDYITKPFLAEEVLARVRAQLALRQTQQHLEIQVAQRTRALRTLSAANQAVVHADSETQLIEQMCRVIVDNGGYLAAWVQLDDGQGYRQRRGKTQAASNCQILPEQDRIADAPVLLFPPNWQRGQPLCECGAKALLSLPVRHQGQRLGCLLVFAEDEASFALASDIIVLDEMAGDLAFGILGLREREAYRQNREALERSFTQTIGALAATIEVRDPYTAGHQQRTTQIAEAIGQKLDLRPSRLKGLTIAATVHDIGKISVPASILSHPGRIGEEEFALIKRHPRTGYEILQGIDFPWPVAEIVLQHHERLDGSGYPLGLQGEAILLEARILAVADVLEAISSHRPYRPALGIEVAMQELQQQRGSKLDRHAVDACLELVSQGLLLRESSAIV